MKAKFDIVNSETAAWPSGKAEDCKSFIPSSNLGAAFEKQKAHDEDYTRDLTLTKGYRVHTSRSRSHLSPLNPPILMLLANYFVTS